MTFAETLRAHCAAHKLTTKQLAGKMPEGFSDRTMQDWMSGRNSPHAWQQVVYLHWLGIKKEKGAK